MYWYPQKAAFRAGNPVGSVWSDANVGTYSVAFGGCTTASAPFSAAWGQLTVASGNYATAFGLSTTASALYATAFGHGTMAIGYYTTASGYNTVACSEEDTVIGSYNYYNSSTVNNPSGTAISETSWVTADPLFEIGNGSNNTTGASDAFVVYKNGNAYAQGTVTTGAGFITTATSITSTDIPMYGH